jgi:hypothetical protein
MKIGGFCTLSAPIVSRLLAEFTESEKSPVRSLVTDATFVTCGAEFTIWLTSIEGATVM